MAARYALTASSGVEAAKLGTVARPVTAIPISAALIARKTRKRRTSLIRIPPRCLAMRTRMAHISNGDAARQRRVRGRHCNAAGDAGLSLGTPSFDGFIDRTTVPA